MAKFDSPDGGNECRDRRPRRSVVKMEHIHEITSSIAADAARTVGDAGPYN